MRTPLGLFGRRKLCFCLTHGLRSFGWGRREQRLPLKIKAGGISSTDMPPAEDQLVNILLIVVVVHLQVLVNAQVLHFSNVSIPIGVGALLACDEGIGPEYRRFS